MGRKQAKIVGGSLVNVYKRLINDCAFENSEICHEGGHGVLKGLDGIFRNPLHTFLDTTLEVEGTRYLKGFGAKKKPKL